MNQKQTISETILGMEQTALPMRSEEEQAYLPMRSEEEQAYLPMRSEEEQALLRMNPEAARTLMPTGEKAGYAKKATPMNAGQTSKNTVLTDRNGKAGIAAGDSAETEYGAAYSDPSKANICLESEPIFESRKHSEGKKGKPLIGGEDQKGQTLFRWANENPMSGEAADAFPEGNEWKEKTDEGDGSAKGERFKKGEEADAEGLSGNPANGENGLENGKEPTDPITALMSRLEAIEKALFLGNTSSDDMEQLHRLYPATVTISSTDALPNAARYRALREKGLTVREAFIASHPDAGIAEAVRAIRRSDGSGKGHLASAVPAGAGEVQPTIPGSSMNKWRALFPDKSDKEIVTLYRATL